MVAANKPHMNYFSRQIISREVEVEKMRRAGPKFKNNDIRNAKSTNCGKENVPNHLRTLNPKSIQQAQQVTKQVVFLIHFLFSCTIISQQTMSHFYLNILNSQEKTLLQNRLTLLVISLTESYFR